MEANCDFNSEIVISGISGRFPKAANVDEFWQNLISGTDMVGDANERYNVEEFDVPIRMAVLKDLDRFDADFFTIHAKQAEAMDPRIKLLLEVAYEAIVDSGTNPMEIQGSNTGVFVANCDGAAGPIGTRSRPLEKINMYGMLGSVSSMQANRLSFTFNFTGPSYVIDTACSSSFVALQQALLSIRAGLCDAAIVASAHTHHDPVGSHCFHQLKMTSADGKCKVFDAAADGYVRSEAAVAIYICKKQVAKRSWGTLVHAQINNDGYTEQGITFPSEIAQEKVIRMVYTDMGINPLEVDYIEAHGTGTKVGDPQEMSAITRIFCEGRKGPLLVGAVKSNMGHPEPVAGLCAIAKVVLANAAGVIPPNLHYNTPNPEIPGLLDGRLKVVDKPEPFIAKYVGFNSMGFGGTNVHVLMKFERNEEEPKNWTPNVPLLLLASGRTQEAVETFLQKALTHRENHNFVGLLHEISKQVVPKHDFRGYVVVESDKTEIQIDEQDSGRQMWFIITGLGSQWPGMSRDLVKFDVFRNSVEKSAQVLLNNNFDILSLLQCGDPKQFEDFKNSVVSITTIQVALIDLLRSIGIQPDGIVGHSTGEVASGYADGCLTQEQAVLTSFARVRAVLESNLKPGMVASVGLTWDNAKNRCPQGVWPVIHNAEENVTIAGSPDDITKFTKELESEGVFVKLVRSASFGFHSPLVEESGKLAKILLEKIISDPKPRSKKWLSSSVPESRWETDLAKYCSADYYVNNGVNPVYFYPTLKHVPENVVALEIGPHCFFQSILKKSLPKNSVTMGLIHVKSPDNCVYFLNSMGKCYQAGINVDVASLYEPIQFPVPAATPSIGSMIGWDHSESLELPHHTKELSRQKGIKISYNLQSETDAFLEGHSIDGKTLFPATGYLYLAWKCFAQQNGSKFEKYPVVFEDVRFERVTLLNKRIETSFLVNIFVASGKFEISESDMLVCSGVIRAIDESIQNEMLSYDGIEASNKSGQFMNKDDFYKEMHLRGYGHSGLFQGIEQADVKGKWAKVKWQGEWVSFIDTILQAFLLLNENRDLYVPLRIQKLAIDPIEITNHLENNDGLIEIISWQTIETGTCPGMEVRGLNFAKFNRKPQLLPLATVEQTFLPYSDRNSPILTEAAALQASIEIALDNMSAQRLSFIEILHRPNNMIAHLIANECRMKCPASEFRLVNKSEEVIDEEQLEIAPSKLVPMHDLTSLEQSNVVFVDVEESLTDAIAQVAPDGFILYKGNLASSSSYADVTLVSQISFQIEDNPKNYFNLFRKTQTLPGNNQIIFLDDVDFSWVEIAKANLKTLPDLGRLYFASKNPLSGIAGFFKCLLREFTSEKFRCYHTIDNLDLDFVKPNEKLELQLKKDLVFNMFKNKMWGTLSNINIPTEQFRKKKSTMFSYANALTLGDLSSLSWIESPLKMETDELVQIKFSSLNFRDVMLASGKLVQDALTQKVRNVDCVMGLEFSGTYKGKRKCGMTTSESLATQIHPNGIFLLDFPDQWSLEEAATVPCVYATVYLALIIRGKMRPGESILIHAGSGGVGQAAIQLALSMNCRVFTTVSSKVKREFLKERFPSLTDDFITNSRDAREFESHIKHHTNGKGVDLVLNSLAQDKLYASIRCLAVNGRFLEIGKFDVFNDTKLGMGLLSKGVSVIGILADQFVENATSEEVQHLTQLIKDGMASETIQPLSYHVFRNDQLEDAFRFMAQGKHIGKVIIQVTDAEYNPTPILSLPRTYFLPSKSYVIIGGLGGMGFELANWMISRGAKKIMLSSRSGNTTTYHNYHIGIWKQKQVQVHLDQSDASTIEGVRSLLSTAQKLGPIGGIFNVAVVLKDALFENQTQEDFEEVIRCKATASINLDVFSRQFAPELDYFVVFSSIIAARGNPGQTNYGFANSVMERICEKRKSEGLPALAIQWGAVGDVGVFHRTMKDKKVFGLAPQSIKSCLDTLDICLQGDKTIVSSFIPFHNADVAKIDPNDSLVNIAANILGIKDIKKINVKTPLVDLGMDSLMAAELAQALQSRTGVQLSQKEYALLTFEKLAELEGKGSNAGSSSSETSNLLQKQLTLKKISDQVITKMKSHRTSDTDASDKIFFVHAIDGTVFMLEELVSQLDANVYGIECVKQAPLESMEKLAAFYIEQIKQVQTSGPYKIAGYSFGACVAFEMVVQMEKRGEIVSLLLLLDGSPKVRKILESKPDAGAVRQEWENKLIIGYLMQYLPQDSGNKFTELFKLESMEEKLQFAVNLLHNYNPDIGLDDLKDLIGAFVARADIIQSYDSSSKISTRTVLIKALKSNEGNDVPYDYGLSDASENVEVIEVDGNHYCFFERSNELGLAAVINKIML